MGGTGSVRVSDARGLAARGHGAAGSSRIGKSSDCPMRFRVGTLKKKTSEVVETASRRRIDLCCLQETRWKGGLASNQSRILTGKDSRYKFYWCGNQNGTGGVGILLAERWLEKVFEVLRISDRILVLKMVIGKLAYAFISVYAPQIGLSEDDKDRFYDQLRGAVSKIPASEILIPLGDWNGHVGAVADGFDGVHGGHGWGMRNPEGERVLEFAMSCELVVANTCFMKRDNHLITYQSGGASTQIDYILLRKGFRKQVTDVKVIPGEECASQHRLLVCDFKINIPPQSKRKFIPRLKIWRLKQPAKKLEFQKAFTAAADMQVARTSTQRSTSGVN